MKNDTTFERMRSGDHPEDAKMSKKAPRSVEFNFFINCDRNDIHRMKKEGQIYKKLPQTFFFPGYKTCFRFFLIFPRALVMVFQSRKNGGKSSLNFEIS